ncbi:MAG: hypothetical protein ACRCYY_08650 [Trueperaceae bacterium]
MFILRLCVACLTLLSFSFLLAQTCTTELRGDLSDEALREPATGTDAVVFLARALKLLEPALPKLAHLPSDFAYLDNEAAVFVGTRGLLSGQWKPDTLKFDVWQKMVKQLASWYDLELDVSDDLSRAGVLATLEDLIEQASAKLEPVALVAAATDDKNKVAFWAVIRQDSIYPRVIVYRPSSENVGLQEGVKQALPFLATCAMVPEKYIYASEETARRLFNDNNKAKMYVAATQPETAADPDLVPKGEETTYLTFQTEALGDYSAFAALFEGSGVSPMTLMSLLPQVRTNMNPSEIVQFVLGE